MTATTRRIKSATRRLRKQQLAERFGRRCAYCRRKFADLRDATLDHIVPNSLWPTGTVTALVLACQDCNRRKGDRFPLSIALLLLRSIDPTQPVVRPVDLPWLARLADANQSTACDRQRSTAYLPESTPHGPTLERTAA
ncbi:restriction endonuclease [Streptomyces hygroscopicus subsp. jinggangensis 5008]|nr:restriction endonuclease [Streptomyces hygroscopicus subsp. jinggangensis 5008]AGF65853.1 restriction endonuclease [Streptomyces hygroscopicus subsp. jinggangensis TL01]